MFEKIRDNIKNTLKKSYDFYLTYGIISFVSVMFVAVLIGSIGRNNRIQTAQNNIERAADAVSSEVIRTINTDANTLKKLSTWFMQIGNPELNFHITREQAAIVLSENIANDPDIKKIYMIWEPNLFDAKDSLYAMTENHDSTGRFVPMFKKNATGIIERDYVKNYNDKEDITSYYYYKTKRNITLGTPQLYRENAKNLLLMPIVLPLRFGTKLLGVIGADFIVDRINQNIEFVNLPKSCGVVVFTHDGKIIAAPEKKLLTGRSLENVFKNNTDYYYLKLRKGENFTENNAKEYIIGRTINLPDYNTHYTVCITSSKDELCAEGNMYMTKTILIGLLIFVAIVAMILILRHYYIGQITQLIDHSKKMTDIEEVEEVKNKLYIPELKNLEDILNRYQRTFAKISSLNREIESHTYNDTLDTLPGDNKFQLSYNKMLETLRGIAASETERKELEERQNWIKQGIALLNESMRIGTNKVDILSDNILSTIVKYTKAVMGGLYLYRKDENEGDYLELISAIALGKKKALRIKIQKGIGMVGTCALEKNTICLTNLPDDYVTVISGLGKSKPRTLVVLPMLYDEELIAILEIAFIHNLNDYEEEFLNVAASTVAGTLVTARINEQTEILMRKFRSQADTLAINEVKMQESIKQLEAEQQKSLEREADMKGLIDAVNNTILTIEYTTKGILITANDKYLNTMHYELEEIQGVNVLDLVKTEREELREVIQNVSTTGQYYEKVMKRFTKSGEVRWLLSTYTPYYNYEGKITKIMYFAFDITETKKQQEELEEKIKQLQAECNELKKQINK